MSRNYGWGSRDMQTAGKFALRATNSSFSSVGTHVERFGKFKAFCKERGIARMERVTREVVLAYGQNLASRVKAGELSPAYAQNLVSSVNTVMNAATRGKWQSVSPTKDCKIAQRCNVRTTPPPMRDAVTRATSELNARQDACAKLAMDLGLRSKEASLFDAKSALREANARGAVTINAGTKGGRMRVVTITNQRQIETLRQAANAQGNARAVMSPNENWKTWREGELRDARETLQNRAQGVLHDLRALYACERYQTLTGHSAPCQGGKIADKEIDRAARMQIAQELGHGRIDVVSAYVGGRA